LAWTAAAQEGVEGSKLAIHGYLTQAFADADDHPIIGIPTDGTTDYRTAALQFRYDMTDKDNFVLQLSHERLGTSPFANSRPAVDLDWAFYQHRFSGGTSVKVGKLQIPIGIYNEIRDVGTLLPFYRPPAATYGEAYYTSETIDGLMLSHTFGAGSRWSLAVDAYGGEWSYLTTTTDVARAEKALGGQLWLATPVEGLRIGLGGRRYETDDEVLGTDTITSWEAAIDGRFERLLLRAQSLDARFEGGKYRSYFVQAGYNVTPRLVVNAQWEKAELAITLPVGPVAVPFDYPDFSEDFALGVNFAFRPDVVLKLEGHANEGLVADDVTELQFFLNQPSKTKYVIASLSVSF
jgi:hypothetical protein